ncbi:TPR domain protein [Sulfitobacter noctilucicola]|uniref:Tetratricopeptide (TPR) repeat protein n=1 Tax=Sulfitobacter noctilucicola TaxID=1342301 RepID=A0A7W6MAI1_9RHOB|nr:tetratricopeptide repeat protein [Sulfitobacter noctilucicola]KIN64144.1 TPR domain protein [Sulfitobacter noctilucicola]MBB4175498.1 tetratricopeptide (TPR) repeat protein [Sulfitobacter noctilucicola]
MKHFILAAAFALPLATTAAAAGGANDNAPTKPKCEKGMIYDKKTKTCVSAQESNLDVDGLYENLRELAYAGRYADAELVLAQMPQDDDRTLTYRGFTQRKQGNIDAAMDFYAQALVANPANILARSYMGQGLVEQGEVTQAIAQLRAIRAHGGTGTWAEASLRTAIATGQTFNY